MKQACALGWGAAAGLVVLVARALAYALAPQPGLVPGGLERAAGGPRLALVCACTLALAVGLAAAIVGIAALAVRERLALERARVLEPPRLRPARAAVRFVLLFAVTSSAFALLESFLHWRAGLGWHGLHCLVGPVHRDAIPLLAGLSLVAVAAGEAIGHLLGWARRLIARLQPQLLARRSGAALRRRETLLLFCRHWIAGVCPARGPPFTASADLIL